MHYQIFFLYFLLTVISSLNAPTFPITSHPPPSQTPTPYLSPPFLSAMFRSKPPRGEPRRLPWRRAKSGVDQPLPPDPTDSTRSDTTDESVKPRPFRRLAAVFHSDSRTDENLRSLKRRVVQVRRQPDAAPVRFQMGFRSRTGWEPIRAAKENQDCLVALVPWGPDSSFNFFAALDGHGRHGHTCAIFIAQRVVAFLSRVLRPDGDRHHIVDTLHRAMLYAQRKLASPSLDTDFQLSGSTGVFVLIHNATLYCANVGDSRAILGREEPKPKARRSNERRELRKGKTLVNVRYFAVPISVDQKPSRPDEKERLLAAGARVDAWEGIDVGEERVWLPEARTPGLAVSRSFGDFIVKDYGVNAIPELFTMDLSEDDRFLVMASDGVFEFMSNDEVVKIVGRWRDRGSAQDAAEELVKVATERWIEDDSVIDDISCVVVFMNVVAPDVTAPCDPKLVETSVGTVGDTTSDLEDSHSSHDLGSPKSHPLDGHAHSNTQNSDGEDVFELETPTSAVDPVTDHRDLREPDFHDEDKIHSGLEEPFFGNTEGDSNTL